MGAMTTRATAPRGAPEQFVSAMGWVRDLLADPVVKESWDAPSALAEYSVAGLAGHLFGAVAVTAHYLSAPAPARTPDTSTAPTDAAGFYAILMADHDPIESALHGKLRSRSGDAASSGHAALVEAFDGVRVHLAALLPDVDPSRLVEVHGGLVVTASAYLETRLVEIVVHLDDLGTSIGRDAIAACDADLLEDVAALLARIAARRNDPLAVIRSLARRERQLSAVHAF